MTSKSRYLARIFEFDRSLRSALPESSVSKWSSHLKSMALPSMSILAHDWPKPVALLAELAEPKFGASVSWLMRHRDEALVMTAALTVRTRTGHRSSQMVARYRREAETVRELGLGWLKPLHEASPS